MAMSNNVVGTINLIAALLSIPVIAAGVWLSTKADDACVHLIQWPVIALGVVIFVAALAGALGAFWRIPWLLISYLVAMLFLIILLAVLVIFVFAVTTAAGSGGRRAHLAPGRWFLEYRLEDYHGWLRRRVEGYHKWVRIKGCVSTMSTCAELNQTYKLAQDFFSTSLTPFQSGCCKPPTACGYTFVNPTYWISPINPASDADCGAWSNDQTQLCYDCDSCKAGLLAGLSRLWRRADIMLLLSLVALVALYLMACFALRKANTEELFKRYRHGYYNNNNT